MIPRNDDLVSSSPTGVSRDPFGAAWRDDRRYVLDVALRMLGDLGRAEDVVQEAFARLFRADIQEIHDVRAWLVTVVSRLCLDQLRSAHHRRSSTGDLFEHADATSPILRGACGDDSDPADRVTLDDTVRLALQVMLERLSPAERTSFVLHDVFQLSFEDIAEIVGRSPGSCRQLASRGRRQLRDAAGPPRFSIETSEQRAVTERFIAACTTGDLDALLAVLSPDVSAEGEDIRAWRDLLRGWQGAAVDAASWLLGPRAKVRRVAKRRAVARGTLRFLGPRLGTTLVSVPTPGDPSVLALLDGKAVALITLTIRDGMIQHLRAEVGPTKLDPVTSALRA